MATLKVKELKVAPLRQLISFGQALEDKVSLQLRARGTIRSEATTALGHMLQPELITADVEVEDLQVAININWRSVPEPDLKPRKLDDLSEWLAPALGVEAPEGTTSIYAMFELRGDELTGSVKPLIYNLELEPAESASLWRSILVEAADFASDLLTLNPGGENDPLATVVPIKGKLSDPGVQLIPAILGVARDAFIVGLTSSFRTIPLDVAPKKESIFSQAAQALVGERWLKAQPEE